MTDVFTPEKRSDVMSRIRGKNTVAETLVFKYLRSQGIYFQKHYIRAAGKPDIALPRKKKAVFIDGDFWHGRDPVKTLARIPEEYWKEKIRNNMERDRRVDAGLHASGWSVLRVWDSDIKRKRTRNDVLERVAAFLRQANQ